MDLFGRIFLAYLTPRAVHLVNCGIGIVCFEHYFAWIEPGGSNAQSLVAHQLFAQRHHTPRGNNRVKIGDRPHKAMHHKARTLQTRQGLGQRPYAVYDEWFLELFREKNMFIEHGQLLFGRCEVFGAKVEPCFAQRHTAWVARQFAQPIDPTHIELRQVIGVHPDREKPLGGRLGRQTKGQRIDRVRPIGFVGVYVVKSVQNSYLCPQMYAFLPIFSLLLLLSSTIRAPLEQLPELRLPESATVAFSGDVMQHLPQVSAARQADGSYDYNYVFRQIAPFWRSADFAVVNLETTLSDTPPYTGYPMFRSPSSLATALAGAGVTHAALANNHAMDAGRRGVEQTLSALHQARITPIGVAKSHDTVAILCKGALRIGLFNATYGTNGMPVPDGFAIGVLDTLYLAQKIAEARSKEATHIVAFLHWGVEYQPRASAEQQALATWLRARGVDAVVGSHPHVVQQVDAKNSVVYSLGNFTSNQRERYKRSGLSVRLTFFEHLRGAQIEALAHYTAPDYTVIVSDSTRSEFADTYQAISQSL